MKRLTGGLIAGALLAAAGVTLQGSSHREAPGITKTPKVDGTDFYMFRSYEAGRSSYVTLIANYLPLQDGYGGPNYFNLDPDAVYRILIDNSGDGVEDLTFQFRFGREVKNFTVPVGGEDVAVPFVNLGAVTGPNGAAQNVVESY